MVALVLVTHSGLATALKNAAEMIVGKIELIETIEITPDDQADLIMEKVVNCVESVSTDGAIIMTDLFGGTPSNIAISLLKDGKVEVLTGVNLPMLIDAVSKRSTLSVPEIAASAKSAAIEGVIVAGEFLK